MFLRQDLDGGVEAVRLVPLYGSSLEPDPPGVEAGHQGSPAGGTLGRGVGLGQQDSFSGIFLHSQSEDRPAGVQPHLQVGSDEERVVPVDFIPPEVVSEDEDDVWGGGDQS